MPKTAPSAKQTSTKPVPLHLTPQQATGYLVTAVRMGDAKREAEARRSLASAKIADAIEKALATAPPLHPSQIKRLSTLLRSAGAK